MNYVLFLGGLYGEPLDSYLNVCMGEMRESDPQNSDKYALPCTAKPLFFAMKYDDPHDLALDLLAAKENMFINALFVVDLKASSIYVHKGLGYPEQLFETYKGHATETYENITKTNLSYTDIVDLRKLTPSLN